MPFWWEKLHKGKRAFLIPVLGCEEVPRSSLQSCGSIPGWRTQRVHHDYGSGMAGGISTFLSSCSFPILCILFFFQQTAVSCADTHNTVIITSWNVYQRDHQSNSFFLLFLLMYICSKENRSKLVDHYVHSWCTCVYFTNLCNVFLHILVSHWNKIWSQNILLTVLAEQWCKEGSSVFCYSKFCCIVLYSSTKFIGCY